MSKAPSKRVMGMGTVYRRSNGGWAAQVSVEGRRRTVYARTEAEVVAKLQALQAKVASGLPFTPERLTVAAFVREWLATTATPRLRTRLVVGTEVALRSEGHFGVSVPAPGVVEPRPTDLFGAVLLALAREQARSEAGAGLSLLRRCARCGRPITARRRTRKWCSEGCRSAAVYARRRLSGATA